MPRKKGDGRGRLGGRAPGTPNKDKPLKTFLRQHSLEYFTPDKPELAEFWLERRNRNKPELDDDGKPTGQLVSQFDIDMAKLAPVDRAEAEIKLLKFHTPQMQATSVDMTISEDNRTLTERLARLAAGEELPNQQE